MPADDVHIHDMPTHDPTAHTEDIIAIIFDRVSQAFGKRLQKHTEVVHG